MIDPKVFHQKIVPVLYGFIWATGLVFCAFNILPHVSGPTQEFLVLAYSVYVIFVLECLVSFIDIGVTEGSWRFITFPTKILSLLIALPVVLIIFTGFLCAWTEFMPLWIILALMVMHKYATAYYLNNPEKYVFCYRSTDVNNRLR